MLFAASGLTPTHRRWMLLGCVFFPLLGATVLDTPLSQYLQFPPRTRYVAHASFSWPGFLVLALFVIGVCLPVVHRLLRGATAGISSAPRQHGSLALWAGAGLVLMLAAWIVAWNRFPIFASLQRFTFTPLWIGYILFINGLTRMRAGTCLLMDRPRFFLLLFPASALFWWYFEFLNRFVQNWYYVSGGDLGAGEYILHASFCFATVLPAVLSTTELLATSRRLTRCFHDWRPLVFTSKRGLGWGLVCGSMLSLACLAALPDLLFPMVWMAPLLLILGMELVAGKCSLFSSLERGNWLPVVLPALAALICGWFWEMWNWKSLAHWEYSIPFVHRYEIFAMPLLGYAGYLPFGLECLAASSLLPELDRQQPMA